MPQRKPRNGRLTELEGAVLGVVRSEGPCTPYRVRREFLVSRSSMWSGSAGAVYPALRRLAAAGLLRAKRTEDSRKSIRYSLSPKGAAAFVSWVTDAPAATGSGLDPFRYRADALDALSPAQRKKVAREMVRLLKRSCAELERLLSKPHPEPCGGELELALHKTRLAWLEKRYGIG